MKTAVFNKYYSNTQNFKYTNPNPTAAKKRTMKWDKGDCVIRALALSTSISWLDAYDYLSERGRRDYATPNDSLLSKKWFVEGGGVWTACKAEKGKKRMTGLDFAKSHPDGRYILCMAHHDCACVDGEILDVWNCGDKAISGYIDMSNFNV